MSADFRDQFFDGETGGVNQGNVGSEHIKNCTFLCPPILEQTEIVRRVDLLFAFADRLEARLQAAQTASARLTPALLAKAFRGELVPQDPNDEPAAELLRRLSENQTKTSAAGQRRNKRKLLPQASPR
jgi:type I restriction enzyme S subunit